MGNSPDFFADPYPAYQQLREAGLIHWSEAHFGGAWVLTRHRDIEALLRDQWEFLRQEPDRIPVAVREFLRYDGPVQYTVRQAGCDMHLLGQFVRTGDLVIGLIGSANRDAERYVEPDRLDVKRTDPGALAFGSGPHVCIGASLTRMEAEIVLRKVVSRWPDLPYCGRQIAWMQQDALRGMTELALTLPSV